MMPETACVVVNGCLVAPLMQRSWQSEFMAQWQSASTVHEPMEVPSVHVPLMHFPRNLPEVHTPELHVPAVGQSEFRSHALWAQSASTVHVAEGDAPALQKGLLGGMTMVSHMPV